MFLEKRLATVKRIYDQQREVWKTKARTVKDRIVSLHLPHIRPIVRGKDGRDVEFGPKILMSWTDGFGFIAREPVGGDHRAREEQFRSEPDTLHSEGRRVLKERL